MTTEPPTDQGELPLLTDVIGVGELGLSPALEQALLQTVLSDVLQRLDLAFEYRLRDALAPVLERACESLIQDAKVELATTLRDTVARAVADELARQRRT